MEINSDQNSGCNKRALDYLETIDFKTLGRTVFTDHLATVSETGKSIGELTVSVSETIRGGEICYYVHAQSHGVVDDVPMGTSVTAYITRGVVTLEQTQHEYIKFPNKPLDKKTILLKEDNKLIVKRITTNGQDVSESELTYPLNTMRGFISEGANIILQRIMCQRKDVPEKAIFLALDNSFCLSTMKYMKLPDKTTTIENTSQSLMVIEREIIGVESPSVTWHTHFLVDGHMASRETIGSTIRMQLINLPTLEEEPRPTEKKSVQSRHDLHWEADMQMTSHYIDRKEELINDHKTFIRHKPELRALLEDFCQFVLLRKPDDVCSFASHYFASFSTKIKPPTVPSTVADGSSE